MLLTIRRSPWCEADPTTLQISTHLTDMLLKSVQSVETTAHKINQLSIQWSQEQVDAAADDRSRSTIAWWLWSEVFFIVPQIPHGCPAQEKLVDFVIAMRDVPDDPDGTWRSLCYFSIAAWEAQNDIKQNTIEELNFYSFTALITLNSISDFSVWALYSLRNILEEEPSHTAPEWWRLQAVQKAAPTLEAHLPVAALWIDLLGETLFRSDGYRGSAARGFGTWKGKKAGFCLERWRLWRRRFEDISRYDFVSERTKEVAKRTWEKMGIIEAENRDVIERAETFIGWMVDFDPTAFGSWAFDPEAEKKRGRRRRK